MLVIFLPATHSSLKPDVCSQWVGMYELGSFELSFFSDQTKELILQYITNSLTSKSLSYVKNFAHLCRPEIIPLRLKGLCVWMVCLFTKNPSDEAQSKQVQIALFSRRVNNKERTQNYISLVMTDSKYL